MAKQTNAKKFEDLSKPDVKSSPKPIKMGPPIEYKVFEIRRVLTIGTAENGMYFGYFNGKSILTRPTVEAMKEACDMYVDMHLKKVSAKIRKNK